MLIKVCGMNNVLNISQVSMLKPDMLGFIFYTPSSRYAGGLSPETVAAVSPEIRKVAVFVNEEAGNIKNTVERYRIETVQLHGSETPEVCRELKEAGLRVIKAIGVSGASDVEQCRQYLSVCDQLLFDTKSPLHGGTGQAFDWKILENYDGTLPFLLSGGITAADSVRVKAFHHSRFAGIDLNSRFETAPGIKDVALLASFFNEIRK